MEIDHDKVSLPSAHRCEQSRNLCRDPEAIHAEVEHEQQRALAEAMVRNMDTHELVAIASGRVSAGLTGSSRSQQRSRVAVDEEQRAGISEVKLRMFLVGIFICYVVESTIY